MFDIVFLGVCLIIVFLKCYKGEKLKWYESIIVIWTLMVFISELNNYYM